MYKQRGALYALYLALALFACEDEPSEAQGGGAAGVAMAGVAMAGDAMAGDAANAGQLGGAQAGGASVGGGSAGQAAGVTGGQTWLPPADMGPSDGGGAQGGEGGEPALTLDMSLASSPLFFSSLKGSTTPAEDTVD